MHDMLKVRLETVGEVMIDEKATLKAFVREISLRVAEEHAIAEQCHMLEGELGTGELLKLLAKYRDDPVRCEGGGSTQIKGGSSFTSSGNFSILSVSQTELDAAQEVSWKELFAVPVYVSV